MIIGARSSLWRPFLVKPPRLRDRCIAHSSLRCFIRVSKLRIQQHCGISVLKTRVNRLRELHYRPFIGLKGSQSRGLYYGVCSEQQPSNQRDFLDLFRQFLVVTPALRFFSQLTVRCSQSRISSFVLS